MKHFNTLFLLLLALFTSGLLSAQTSEKCAADLIRNEALDQNPDLQEEIEASELEISNFINRPTEGALSRVVLTIPVVIHIIHNSEAIGEDANISEQQALSLLTRLNEDFRKTNADTLDQSSPFYSDQADTEIEFCLATQDPNGDPTSGIERYDFDQEGWSIKEIDSLVKPATIWDRYSYMNVWSINLDDPDSPGVDGYGTFPTSTTDTTDGIVILYTAYGELVDGKSIVGTHEVGHYLNLFHIWGDNIPDCGDDQVSDTPPTDNSNEGCPDFPHNPNNSCGSDANGEMFMNYMDYSDAECTVMFTNGQKDRMQATLMTLRSSLLSSSACNVISSTDNSAPLAGLKVFPNPSKGTYRIDIPDFTAQQLVHLSVFDISGAKLQDSWVPSSSQVVIELTDLPEGVYFLRATHKSNSVTTKLIKAN